MAQRKPQLKFENLKEISALSSEIIATRTDDGRRTDGRTTDEFRFHELC